MRFEIPVAEAHAGLNLFAKQSGTPVLYLNEIVGARKTNAVIGQYTVARALEILLRNTGITGNVNEVGVVTVKSDDLKQNAEQGDLKLKNETSVHRGTSIVAAVAAFFASIAASGQTRAAGAEPAAQDHGALEEITVTARRREENVQTVPIAVTVLSQQTLQQNNVQTLTDLQYLVPALSVNANAPNEARLDLRGQGVSGNSGQPGVIMYLNEVPIPVFPGGVQNAGPGLFFDLENVQVLKGPQGTLFGNNSVGGNILLQTARPKNEFEGRLQLSYGNYNDREIDGAVSIPLLDNTLLTRTAINGQIRDGYTHILSEPSYPGGIDGDNRHSWSVRETISFRPTDWFDNETVISDSKYTARGVPGLLTQVYPSGASGAFGYVAQLQALLAQQQALGVRTALPIDVDDITNGGSFSVSNITRFALGENLTLRNIFGYDREDQILEADQDNTNIPFFDAPSNPRRIIDNQYSDELQLLGDSFAHHFKWIVGAFWMDQPRPAIPAVQDIQVFGVVDAFSTGSSGLSSKALFAQGTYDLSPLIPDLKVTGGIRYAKDVISAINRNGAGTCDDARTCGAGTDIFSEAPSHALTWTAGLDYQLNEGTLLYLTSRRGYRPGGYNTTSVVGAPPPPTFGPEFVQDLELGLKSDWKLGSIPIRTNLDVWGENYTDLQVQALIPGSIDTLTQNAGRARLWGAELEAVAQLTSNLQVGVTYDHVNLQYKSFDSGVSQATIDALVASRTTSNPPNKYGISARYRLPLPSSVGEVAVKGLWTWQAAAGDTSVPNGYGIIPSFGLLNLNADWNGIVGSPFDVSLFASNLLNKTYLYQAVPYFDPGLGYGNQVYGEPRMYGIRVGFHFGAKQ